MLALLYAIETDLRTECFLAVTGAYDETAPSLIFRYFDASLVFRIVRLRQDRSPLNPCARVFFVGTAALRLLRAAEDEFEFGAFDKSLPTSMRLKAGPTRNRRR